jgi:hypothetical protein
LASHWVKMQLSLRVICERQLEQAACIFELRTQVACAPSLGRLSFGIKSLWFPRIRISISRRTHFARKILLDKSQWSEAVFSPRRLIDSSRGRGFSALCFLCMPQGPQPSFVAAALPSRPCRLLLLLHGIIWRAESSDDLRFSQSTSSTACFGLADMRDSCGRCANSRPGVRRVSSRLKKRQKAESSEKQPTAGRARRFAASHHLYGSLMLIRLGASASPPNRSHPGPCERVAVVRYNFPKSESSARMCDRK